MGKGKRKKARKRPRKVVETASYTDDDVGVLILRKALSIATIEEIAKPPAGDATSIDDAWQRREEMLFERLAVSWEIAGLPITDQKTLLGRYRMANDEERRWVRGVIRRHVDEHIPGVDVPWE